MDALDIGVVVSRLDFLHRMLVFLDVEEDVVNMIQISTLNENSCVLERSSSAANDRDLHFRFPRSNYTVCGASLKLYLGLIFV